MRDHFSHPQKTPENYTVYFNLYILGNER